MADLVKKSEIEVDGDVIINGKAYPAIQLLEALTNLGALSFDFENAQLLLNGTPVKPLYKSTRKAIARLCYHSLAYCCPTTQECDKRDTALKMLNISSQKYSELKEELHERFLKLASSVPGIYNTNDDTLHKEFSPSSSKDDSGLTSLFGTPDDKVLNTFNGGASSEKQNSEDFLREFLSGNNFENNNLWDKPLSQRELRYGRKNIPPSTETSLRHSDYTRRCSRCKKFNNSEDKYCSRCGAELGVDSLVSSKV